LVKLNQRVASAAAASSVFGEDTARDQIFDVAQGSVLRAFGKLRPFRRCQLAFEAVEQPVQNEALPLVERRGGMRFPKAPFSEDRRQDTLRTVDCAVKATEEPLKPRCDVEIAFLCPFQNLIVRPALKTDLRRHAVKTLRTLLRPRKGHVSDGARNPPVAINKRMDRDEP
jgi:hypothetical protein